MYETGESPEIEVTMIALRKKLGDTKISNHCTISFITHNSKVSSEDT
jgi:hypothetical protein